MKKTKKALASLAIAGMTLSMIPFNVFAASPVPTRIAGVTAEQTAVKIADQTGYTGTAILASSTSYGMVDALTAGPLAAFLKAPILLTGAGDALNADTKAELGKLAVKKVYVTSGTAVIKQGVVDELKAMGIEVVALGGFDRAETSVNIAKQMSTVAKVAVANGIPDALSIASIAAANNQPILMTNKDSLPASVAAYLAANPAITISDVIGGTGVISDAVKAALPGATRHAGMTAYDTNNQVIQDFAAGLKFDNVYMANGVTGIDALAGAPLAAQTNSAIVLTDGVTAAAGAFVSGKLTASSVVTALGGTAVVPDSVLTSIDTLSVSAVSAINGTQLKVVGTGLGQLKADEITVEGTTVTSVSASADGTSATVTIADEMVLDAVTKVTVNGASFDVTYKVEATTVSVVEATYDDDTADQFVKIQIDGKAVTAQELVTAGYTVDFEAFDSKAATTDITATLFDDTTTGELKTDLALTLAPPTSGKDVYVKVTLTKGSDVITSSVTKVNIKNIDLAADSITDAVLTNYGADKALDGGWNDDFEQNSSTLRTGESAEFTEITVKAGSSEDDVTSGYTVKSSDASVVSVDSNGVLTAQGPGTATITLTYGGAKYTKSITVKNEARTATKVDVEKTSLTLTKTSVVAIDATLLDQYGDPMAITATNVVLAETDVAKATAALGVTTDASGTVDLTFTGVATGASTVSFRDADGVKIGTTSVRATVVENDTLSQYTLTVDDNISSTNVTDIGTTVGAAVVESQVSTDSTIDLAGDKYLKVDIAGKNSAGVEVSNPQTDAADYTVTTSVSVAGVLDATNPVFKDDGYLVVQAGTKTGTATITVTNVINPLIVKTFKVTVVKVGDNVVAATLKTVPAPTYDKTYTYKNFLSYTAGENDPIITGITLSKASAQPVRLDLLNDKLYIDKDADGVYTAGTDVLVGSVLFAITGSITGTYTTTATGVDVASGDDGTVLFKVLDNGGNVRATRAVVVDF